MSKENLILAQLLKQADKGRWFTRPEIENICKVYDTTMEKMRAFVNKLQREGKL